MHADPEHIRTYEDGQLSIVNYFAAALVSLPIEYLLKVLDASEENILLKLSDSYSRGSRMRDRDVCAVLVEAKASILALYVAYGAAARNTGVVRDSTPPLAVPLDPMHGRAVSQEGN